MKLKILLFSGIVLLSILFVGMGTDHLEFDSGTTLQKQKSNYVGEMSMPDQPWKDFKTMFFVVIVAFVLVCGAILPETRKRLFVYFLLACLITVLVSMDYSFELDLFNSPEAPKKGAIPPEIVNLAPVTPVEQVPPAFPWGLILGISFLFTAPFFFYLYRRFSQSGLTLEEDSSLDELAQQAQKTIQQLQSGDDFKNTVIRCYIEMSEVLSHSKGVEREQAMTPREFEESLLKLGVPEKPIQQLTELFEKVRYGRKSLSPEEEKDSVQCLFEIVQACEKGKA